MEQASTYHPSIPPVQIYVLGGWSSNAPLALVSSATHSPTLWYRALSALENDWIEFSLLTAQWKLETGHLSSRTKKTSSRFYRRIMEMGRDRAVPQIIRQLKAEGATPNHWWPALQELTGVDPVPPEVSMNIREVARIWIEWGRIHYGGQLGPK